MTCSSVTGERSLPFTYRNLGNFRGFYSQHGKLHKTSIHGGHTVGPSANRRKALAKSIKVTPTCRPVIRRPVKTMPKLGGFELLEQNSSKGNIRTFSIKVQWTLIDVSLEFHADLSRYREKQLRCTRYKNAHLFAAILRPFGQGRQNFYTWVLSSACICLQNFISGSVKVCRIICEKPILSNYILRCQVYAWQLKRNQKQTDNLLCS